MSAFRPLLDRRAEILSSVAGSTAAIDTPELVGCLERAFDDAAGVSYSEKIERGIRRAVGALRVDTRGAIAIVMRRIERGGPEKYGLDRVPDRATVTRVLAKMARERFTQMRVWTPASTHERIASAHSTPMQCQTAVRTDE